eukprot:1139847-Pelagomonas_calceolata.AAC.2
MTEQAEIHSCWKVARRTPLYQKGFVLDPGNYRMLAVSGTLYRLYANVLREVVTAWCQRKKSQALRLVSDTIPREALLTHLQRICMPTCLLASIKSMYANDKYILVEGYKQARVRPHLGVKQGCLLPPCFFSLHINNVDCLAEIVQGAVTGSSEVQVTQLLSQRLHAYAQQKGLVIIVAKSEIMHFNSRGDNMPVFTLGGGVSLPT